MFSPAAVDPRYAAKRQFSSSFALPAPVGGLNARDANTAMKPLDAKILTNVFPEASYCTVRKGFEQTRTIPGAARTLMTYNAASGSDQLFVAADIGPSFSIFNALTAGSGPVQSGLVGGDYQWTNITTAGGSYLFAVNGADSAVHYNGSVWANPAITGATSSTFTNVCLFKERLWFAKLNSTDLYYLPTQSVAGAVTLFPVGSVFRRGGYVIGLSTFSYDAGDGPDDYFCIISSNGEILLYQGTDPSNPNTFALVGRFDVGKPIGRRCTVRMSGDLAVVTQDGMYSMQAAMKYGREQIQKATITGKIQTLFSQYSASYFSNFGWAPCVFPPSRYLIVNIPTETEVSAIQLVMNTITGAWCQFEGLDGTCWGVANDNLYFGGATSVYHADTGYFDSPEPGVTGSIDWEILTSWQMLGGARNKFFTLVKPTMMAGAGTAHTLAVDVDFRVSELDAPDPSTGTGMIWGVWRWPGFWAGATPTLNADWHSTGAIGTWSAIHIKGLQSGAAAQLNSFELIAEAGGPL